MGNLNKKDTFHIRWSHITNEKESGYQLWWHDEELAFEGYLEEAIIKAHYHLIKALPLYKDKMFSVEIIQRGKVVFLMKLHDLD